MTSKSLRFESFTLDLDRLCLHGPSGPADLRRKSFEVLRYLVEHAGRVVTKEEMLAAIWPDVTVGDESLTQCISEVRRALGDKSQRIIKTVARRGYLIDVPISEREAPGPARQSFALSESFEAPRPRQLPTASHPAPDGQDATPLLAAQAAESSRRQVTALACNFGVAALGERVDPEDLSAILAECHSRTREVVEAHGGFVAKNLVDGAHFLFGYPRAREDDAERAVRAGLAVARAVRELKFGCVAEPLQVRVGIATGVVVIGDPMGGLDKDHGAVGDAPLLASLLLGLVHTSAVMVSASTRGLIGSLFECRDLGAAETNQLPQPVEAWEVLRENATGSRLEALRSVARKLVGREEELEILLRRWQQAKSGAGQVALLTGEAGIGKSRLARALQERLGEEQHTSFIYHCSPHHRDSALHPIVGQLLRAADIERDESVETKLAKLGALLRRWGHNIASDMPLYCILLSIPGGDHYPLPDLTPQRLKALTLGALLNPLKHLAAQAPVLMVFEDLHWIDPTSLELLSLVVDQVPKLRLFLVATCRPEFSPPWASHRHISTVLLNRLGRDEGQTLVTAIARGKALPPDVLDQILDRSDGIPLFIEELSKSVLETGSLRAVGDRYELIGPLAELSIPATLHASLLARLDRSAAVKDVAQIGATIGREFAHNLVAAVCARPERELQAALAQLVDAELIFQRGATPDATYLFKHALVQETAYASLVRNHRRELHGKIARALEEHCPEIVASVPEILAHHYTEGGLTELAVRYWLKAGEHYFGRSAYVESARHLSQAIELLSAGSQAPATLRKELDVRIKLGPILIALKGINSVEVEGTYLRARELVDALGETSYRFPALWGLWFVNYSRANYDTAREAGEQLLDAAQSTDDKGQLLEAHHALWATRSAMGHAAAAVGHMEYGIALYDRDQHADQASIYGGHDPCACCHYHLAINLWLLGYPDRSLEALQQALRQCEQLKHPITTVIALWYAAWVYYHRRDQPSMRASLEQLLALADEHAIFSMPHVSRVLLEADTRSSREELGELHRTLQATAGANRWQRVFCQCVLAELFGQTGHPVDGLAVLASISARDRDAIYAPEILRLEGELRRRLSPPDTKDIERCLLAALGLASQRSEKSLELRAATSLARLRRDQGDHALAHKILKPVYDWFTEGLDLPDLMNARALLDQLARPS